MKFLFLLLLQSHFIFSEAPLFYSGGSYTHPISSKVPLAQQYFDQGMIFFYGFNYEEAARSFQEAANLDPECAICYWGKALALKGGDDAAEAKKSLEQAQKLIGKASPKEQAYINNFEEMGKVVKEYPEDLDAKTLAAHAKMKGIAGDKDVLEELKEVLSIDPNHPGALHYHIHLIEATKAPIVEGLPSAEKLNTLIPIAGHLLHMPAHIYFKMGRYHDATLANQRALKADEDVFARGGIKGKYFASYHMHNNQFDIASLIMEGKKEEATDAARKILSVIEKEKPELTLYMDNAMSAQPLLVLQRFGDWDQILIEPEPKTPFGKGMRHFSRSLAYIAKGNIPEAKKEADLIQNEKVGGEEDWMNTLLKVTYLNALAAIAEKEGNQEKAFEFYENAVELEDSFVSADPPVWFMSSREAYGKALLRVNRPEDAQKQFQKDLEITPNKMWSMNAYQTLGDKRGN